MTKPSNNRLFQIIISILTGLSIAAVGWAFSEIRDMPEKYPTKQEMRNQRQDICERLDRIEDRQVRIENKVDQILLKQK